MNTNNPFFLFFIEFLPAACAQLWSPSPETHWDTVFLYPAQCQLVRLFHQLLWISHRETQMWTRMWKNQKKNQHFFQNFQHNLNNFGLLCLLKSIANSVLGLKNAIARVCSKNLLFSDPSPKQRVFTPFPECCRKSQVWFLSKANVCLGQDFVWAREWKIMTHILHLPGSWICPSVVVVWGRKPQSLRKMMTQLHGKPFSRNAVFINLCHTICP